MGFLSSIAKGAGVVPATQPAAVAPPPPAPTVQAPPPAAPKKSLIEDQSTIPDAQLKAARAELTTPGKVIPCGNGLIQRGIYQLPNGEERMFLCSTHGKYSFTSLVKGGVPVLLDEGTPVIFVRDAGPNMAPPMVLPPDAPKSDPALAARVPAQPAPVAPPAGQISDSQPAPAAEAPKAKRGRPTKEEAEAKASAKAQQVTAQQPPALNLPVAGELMRPPGNPLQSSKGAGGEGSSPALADRRLRVYVNCIVPKVAGQSLLPWLEELSRGLLDAVGLSDVPDIRLARGDVLGFGKWAGALAVAARQSPPPPGDYLVTGEDERIRAVLPVLESLCAPGDYVVGR